MSTPDPATTPWVPLWDLNGGVDLAYLGAWQSGVTYRDGQVIIYNGTAYLCTRQTTRVPTPWPMGIAAATYNTTLPLNPVDGQEAILVDSLTSPTYQWRLRYNARSTSHKWEFVGGPPMSSVPGGSSSLAVTSAYQSIGGATLTVPRTGSYWVDYTVTLYAGPINAHITNLNVLVAGFGTIAPDTGLAGGAASSNLTSFAIASHNYISLTAGNVLTIGASSAQANTFTFLNRTLSLLPHRIS